MEPLRGRTAVVVGASSGVGQAVARRLAEEGVTVFAAARREGRLAELAAVATAAGRIVPVATDVRDPTAVAALFDRAEAATPPFDLVVNAAGVVHYGDFATQPADDWDEMVGINLVGALHVLQAGLQRLLPRGGGRIVQVTSVTATLAIPGVSVYGATKAGLSRLLAGLRGEYAEQGVRIAELELGATRDTEAGRGRSGPLSGEQGRGLGTSGGERRPIESSPEVLDRLLRWSGGGRTLRLDDVVDAVLFLLQAGAGARVDHLRLREPSDIPT